MFDFLKRHTDFTGRLADGAAELGAIHGAQHEVMAIEHLAERRLAQHLAGEIGAQGSDKDDRRRGHLPSDRGDQRDVPR